MSRRIRITSKIVELRKHLPDGIVFEDKLPVYNQHTKTTTVFAIGDLLTVGDLECCCAGGSDIVASTADELVAKGWAEEVTE